MEICFVIVQYFLIWRKFSATICSFSVAPSARCRRVGLIRLVRRDKVRAGRRCWFVTRICRRRLHDLCGRGGGGGGDTNRTAYTHYYSDHGAVLHDGGRPAERRNNLLGYDKYN